MDSTDKPIRIYHPELDVLRFFAFLMVFIHHLIPQDDAVYTAAIFQNNLWLVQFIKFFGNFAGIGLPIFFCLSAYIIAMLLTQELQRTGTVHLKAFHVRRILRIWPLYYFALLCAVVIALYQHSTTDLYFIAAASVFVGNWLMILPQSYGPMQTPFYPLWSMSVQEQFYIIFPVLLLIVKGNAVEKIACSTILISLLSSLVEGNMHLDIDRALFGNGLSLSIFFGVGMLMATKLAPTPFTLAPVLRFSLLIAATVLFACSVRYFNFMGTGPAQSGAVIVAGYSLCAAGCAALLTGIYGITTKFPKPIVYLGKISFGLYIFHIVSMEIFAHEVTRLHLTDIGARIASISLTIFLAAFSYNFIEKPFLKLKSRFSFIESRPN